MESLNNKNRIQNTQIKANHNKIIISKPNPFLQYKEKLNIINNNGHPLNELFEVFKLEKDNQMYLITPNYITNNIDLFQLTQNKIITSFEGHNSHITSLRYFKNEKTNENYLISSDQQNIVILWEILPNVNFKIKYIIQTDYTENILSCLLLFNININNNIIKNYIITSCSFKGCSKIYSLDTGNFIKNINVSLRNLTNYLLYWNDSKNNKNYIIECCFKKISIYDLETDESYANLITEKTKFSEHFSGIIYNKNNIDYLVECSNNGYINIWNLYNKEIYHTINSFGCKLRDITKWDNDFIIVTDYGNKLLKIVDLKQLRIIGNIGGNNLISIKMIKLIRHPVYGKAILSSGFDNNIRLWVL